MDGSQTPSSALGGETADPGHAAAARRYRRADAPAPVAWNETLAVILDHRSVRAFLPDPLPDGTLETLVTAAQSASSSSNLQVWSVVAVEDQGRRARLAHLAGDQKHIVEAPLFLIWLIDFTRIGRLDAVDGQRSQALDYLETFLLGAVDTSLAAQSAVVALESLGLGSVYIGGIRNQPAAVAAELALPAGVFALFGLAIGKPDLARPTGVKPRLPQASVLFRETYEWTDARDQAAKDYDVAIRAFQRDQGMVEKDWTRQVRERTRGPESMAGRHRLRQVLNDLGFDLR